MDHNRVTIDEVFRLVQSLKHDHGATLDAIEKQVRITNGRTTHLEMQVALINREREVSQRTPVVLPEGESFTLRVTPKMWAAIASVFTGLSVFGPMLAEWIKKLFSND
jgi:hypothetical protein